MKKYILLLSLIFQFNLIANSEVETSDDVCIENTTIEKYIQKVLYFVLTKYIDLINAFSNLSPIKKLSEYFDKKNNPEEVSCNSFLLIVKNEEDKFFLGIFDLNSLKYSTSTKELIYNKNPKFIEISSSFYKEIRDIESQESLEELTMNEKCIFKFKDRFIAFNLKHKYKSILGIIITNENLKKIISYEIYSANRFIIAVAKASAIFVA